MVVRLTEEPSLTTGFNGLRMTADEYFALPDDGSRYELIDGVVVMSPSPSVAHQRVSGIIFFELKTYVDAKGLGEVLFEIDLKLDKGLAGRDIVYRPDVICFRGDATRQIDSRLQGVIPAVVVEVVSADSAGRDRKSKLTDYQRFGIAEYWLVDQVEEEFHFFQLRNGGFVEVATSGDQYESAVIPGFRLDLARVRVAFRALK